MDTSTGAGVSKYAINIEACDDQTTVVLALTPDEVKLLEGIAAIFNDMRYIDCKPGVKIRKANESDEREYREALEGTQERE